MEKVQPVDEVLPLPQLVAFGLQHVLVMAASPITAAFLVSRALNFTPALTLNLISATFLICVLGGLGNFFGGFIAAFVFAEIISLGGLFSDLEWGYVLAFGFFIVMMFIRPAGLLSRRR